jgi:hypothetical protein
MEATDADLNEEDRGDYRHRGQRHGHGAQCQR